MNKSDNELPIFCYKFSLRERRRDHLKFQGKFHLSFTLSSLREQLNEHLLPQQPCGSRCINQWLWPCHCRFSRIWTARMLGVFPQSHSPSSYLSPPSTSRVRWNDLLIKKSGQSPSMASLNNNKLRPIWDLRDCCPDVREKRPQNNIFWSAALWGLQWSDLDKNHKSCPIFLSWGREKLICHGG